MPAVRPLSPAAIRKLLEAKGYTLIAADDWNWAFALGDDDEPIFIPITVDLVPVEVAFSVARKIGFNTYFDAMPDDDPFPPDTPDTPPGVRPS